MSTPSAFSSEPNPGKLPATPDGTLSAPRQLDQDAAPVIDVAHVPKGHPPGLFLLFFVEMWERFSYYGMRALLVLYLIASANHLEKNPGRGWSEKDANYLYGWYVGLAYLLPLLGGFLADKFLGTHRSMVIGAILISLGHIVLGITGMAAFEFSALGMSIFIGGLALIVIGTGYFKPCVTVMVGQLYPPGDPRREGAFTIFYMGINVGAFLCAFVCGTLGEKVGWHWGFGAAAVGMLAGLTAYLIGRPYFLQGIGTPPPGRTVVAAMVLFVLSLVAAVLYTGFYHFGGFGKLGEQWGNLVAAVGNIGVSSDIFHYALYGLFFAVALAAVIRYIVTQQPGDKGPVATIFIFMCFNAFFWVAFEQAGSTLNVFAKDSTDRSTPFGYEVPATWFQSINPLLIILLAPVFAILWSALGRRRMDPSQPAKIGIALILVGLGYIFVVAAAYFNLTGTRVSMFWLTALYTVHTVGELCISPTGLSYVTSAAPKRSVSLLMGIWFISSFLAGYVGGLIASYVEDIEKGNVELPWHIGGRADFFFLFVVTSIGAGLVILILTPLFKKLMRPEPGQL